MSVWDANKPCNVCGVAAMIVDKVVCVRYCAPGEVVWCWGRNEALNAIRMQELLTASEFFDTETLVIPKPIMELTTRSDLITSICSFIA